MAKHLLFSCFIAVLCFSLVLSQWPDLQTDMEVARADHGGRGRNLAKTGPNCPKYDKNHNCIEDYS